MSTPTFSTQLVWRSMRQQEHEGNWEGGEKQHSGEGATRESTLGNRTVAVGHRHKATGAMSWLEFGMMANQGGAPLTQ